jgi:hypothetical protein
MFPWSARRIDTASALRGGARERATASPDGRADEKERNFAIRWLPSKKRGTNGGFQDNRTNRSNVTADKKWHLLRAGVAVEGRSVTP